jgi:hypothetical protein
MIGVTPAEFTMTDKRIREEFQRNWEEEWARLLARLPKHEPFVRAKAGKRKRRKVR